MEQEEINNFRKLFADVFLYIELDQVSDAKLKEYLEQPHVSKESTSFQLSLCADWCMAQQQCDIQE